MFKRKYFIRFDSQAIQHSEDVKKIREYLNSIGTVDATDIELEKLYSEFSECLYSAGWLSPHDDFLERFAEWLETYEE